MKNNNRIKCIFDDAYFSDGEFVIELSYSLNNQYLPKIEDIMKLVWKPAFIMTGIGMFEVKNGVLGNVKITEVDVNNNFIKVAIDGEFDFDGSKECINSFAHIYKSYIKDDLVWLENITQSERNGNMKYIGEVQKVHGFDGKTYVECSFPVDTPISYNTVIVHKNGNGTIEDFYSHKDKLSVNILFPTDCTIAKGDMVEVVSEDIEEEVYQKTVLANVNQIIHSGVNKAFIDMDIMQAINRHNGLTWQLLEIKIMDRINSSVSTNIEIGLDLDYGALEEVEKFGQNIITAVAEAREKLEEE